MTALAAVAVAVLAVTLEREILPTKIFIGLTTLATAPQLVVQLAPPVILKFVVFGEATVNVPLFAATELPVIWTESPATKLLVAVTTVLLAPFVNATFVTGVELEGNLTV